MDWSLRYAPHIGYLPPERPPLFRYLVGPSLADHIRFAAQEGMAGVLDPWMAARSREQQQEIGAVLRETGLECGCLAAVPLASLTQPLWVAESTEPELFQHVEDTLNLAAEVGSNTIVVLLFGEAGGSPGVQRSRVIERLRRAADRAERQQAILVIEPMDSLPGMLLQSFAEGVELVREVAHPCVKLAFDTGHLVSMGEPVLPTYIEAYDDIGLLQLADMPGRVEVGRGEIDFVPILAHAIRQKYAGLVELEHDWSTPGADSERQGIEKLRAVDAAARRIASQE